MRDYEMMVIVDPEIGDDKIQETLEHLKKIIEGNGGKVDKIDDWGRRTLAYEIKHKKEGYYAVYYFSGEPTLPEKLRREFSLNPAIMRGMILKRGG